MTDMIFITGVVIHARHGVMEHETEVGQRFVIDLELSADLSESSRTDRLADTVSYSNVWQPRRPPSRMPTINCWSARPAPLPRHTGVVFSHQCDQGHRSQAARPIAAIFEDVGVVLTRTRQAPSHG